MKIFCIGRNYEKHAKEMNSVVSEKPIVFMKPQTSLVKNNQDVYYPEFTKDLHFECELVLKIGKPGKSISPEFAMSYISEVTVGIDLTARDLQQEAKKKGQPWEIAKGFDQAAPIGAFLSADSISDWENLEISLDVNGEQRQNGVISDLIFPIPTLISYISKFFTIQTGDLIFTGTPEGVGPLQIGDELVARLNGQTLLEFSIK